MGGGGGGCFYIEGREGENPWEGVGVSILRVGREKTHGRGGCFYIEGREGENPWEGGGGVFLY